MDVEPAMDVAKRPARRAKGNIHIHSHSVTIVTQSGPSPKRAPSQCTTQSACTCTYVPTCMYKP